MVNAIIIILLVVSFIGGLVQGAVKSFFSLLALIISVILAGMSYYLLADLLSFLPGDQWPNFAGFIVAWVAISVILHIIFFLPRILAQKFWIIKGLLFRLLGGVVNVFNIALGMVVFAIVVQAYPVTEWLLHAVTGSSVLSWMVRYLGFVRLLLPDVFQNVVQTIANWQLFF